MSRHTRVVRIALALVLVAACSRVRTDAQQDATTGADARRTDAEDVADYVAPVTDVLVTTTGTLWTYGTEACSLEFGCFYGDTTVSQLVPPGSIYVVDTSPAGAMAIAGDDDGAFIVTGFTHEERYVKRVQGGALSIPRPWTRGPAVDATHVYWLEQPQTYGAYALRKASRTGDGSDATTIATGIADAQRMTTFAGHVWFFGSTGLSRVPTSGGAVEQMITAVQAMAVAPSGLIVGRRTWSSTQVAEIGRFDASGAYTVIVDVGLARPPMHLVADDRDVFWAAPGPNPAVLENLIFRYPLAGGPIEQVATQTHQGYAFAITPDKVLFDFTPEGFQSAVR